MLWILRFIKHSRGRYAEGTLRIISTQILRDSKLSLADPESQLFLLLCSNVSHGQQNLRSQFEKLLGLISTYHTFLVDITLPINFLRVVSSILSSLRFLSWQNFFCRVAFWITSFISFFSRFRVAYLFNITLQWLSDACPKSRFR